MIHERELIHLARLDLKECGAEEPFVRNLAEVIESIFRLAGGVNKI